MIFIEKSPTTTHKYFMYQSSLWPAVPGVNIITQIDPQGFYTIPQSQVVVFPFSIYEPYDQVRISASHVSFYGNQQNSILAWISDQPNGRNITGTFNSNLDNVNLSVDGYKWLFHLLENTPYNTQDTDLIYWLSANQNYFACFRNLENKNNQLYCKIEYQHR